MQVPILFSQSGILAANKPAGMCSQAARETSIPELWELARMWSKEGFVPHRIDRFTSGINLVTINSQALVYLQRNWHSITRKVYLAVAPAPNWDTKSVSIPIDEKTATTQFVVLQRTSRHALIQCELSQNGRKHQIRRHLKYAGYPIVGDRLWGGEKTEVRAGQLLHAWQLEFRVPKPDWTPGEWVKIQARVPEDFKSFGFDTETIDVSATSAIVCWNVPEDWKRPS